MSESEGPPRPSETTTTQSDSSGGIMGKLPDVSMGEVEVPWKSVAKRFARTKPEVDIEELTEEYGSRRRAHGIAFVRKFLGADGMPALAHLVLAILPNPRSA